MNCLTKHLALTFGLVTLFSPLANADFSIPHYEKTTLENGLTVYVMEQHEVPLVDIIMVNKAGAILDKKDYGLANMTGDALRFGSGKRSKQDLEDLLAFHGANFSSRVSAESTSIRLSLAAKDTEQLLPIFSEIILEPSFNKDEFNKEKKRFVEQLKQSRERPRSIIRGAFNRMYFAQHPYGNPVSGDSTSVEKITLSQVKSFYKKNYVASNSAIIVVGDFNSKDMIKKITSLFSSWKKGSTKNLSHPVFLPPSKANVWLIDKSDAIETTFMFGGKGIAVNHPDSVAIQVINTIMGARFTSWLNDELRVNSGLTYGARSSFQSFSENGTFSISTFTKKETTFEALDLAIKTYQRIWDKGIDKKTLESAKAYVKGQFPPRYETGSQLASLLAKMWSQKLDDSFINDFQKNVDSLNVKKANKIAKENFPKDHWQFVLIGKADDIEEKAKNYGEVKRMDIKTFEF